MSKAGRPTKLNSKVRREICERLAGGESLRSVCRDEHLPHISTVLLWVVENREEFSEQYMRAREAGGFAHADRILDVVDRTAQAEYDPNQARAMMDGLKWAAERMAPKQHSPRTQQEHTSPDGSMTPTQIVIQGPDDDDAQT